MRSSKYSRGHRPVLLRSVAAGLLAFGASQAMAVNVSLCAEAYTVDLPGAAAVPMWGYRALTGAPGESACGAPATTDVHTPVLTVPANDPTLVVTLVNALRVPTSIVLAGQDLPYDGTGSMAPVHATDVTDLPASTVCAGPSAADLSCRVRSFTGETAPGATRVYTFGSTARPLRPGTFLYQSGTHPQVQVQMGLAGILAKDATPSVASLAGRFLFNNPDWVFDADAPVLLSEVDDAMHRNIANTLGSATPGSWKAGANSTLNYSPRFFLINGKPYDGTNATDLPVQTFNGGYVVLRMANAGLRSRSLVLNNGHWQVLTEDGNSYPAPREQYSLLLPAGKTSDAQISVAVPATGVDKSLALFDRRGGTDNADTNPLGGQVARIALTSGGPAPTDVADLSVSKSDGLATVFVGDAITYNRDRDQHRPEPGGRCHGGRRDPGRCERRRLVLRGHGGLGVCRGRRCRQHQHHGQPAQRRCGHLHRNRHGGRCIAQPRQHRHGRRAGRHDRSPPGQQRRDRRRHRAGSQPPTCRSPRPAAPARWWRVARCSTPSRSATRRAATPRCRPPPWPMPCPPR